ncbi:MAG: hypothetical protein QMD13_10025 [Candidatus Bathyarchaeia archaeon]|nr:hypothetical protein [Candidatus Bathyarchaeia archaeon]
MKKVSNSDVGVIIAAFNEEKGIGPTLRELREALEVLSILWLMVIVLMGRLR